MELTRLHYVNCPHCGSRITSEHQTNRHCNGDWFESQHFECGFVIEYVPKYRQEHELIPCSKSANAKLKEAKRKTAADATREFMETLDVDIDFKKRLIDCLDFI